MLHYISKWQNAVSQTIEAFMGNPSVLPDQPFHASEKKEEKPEDEYGWPTHTIRRLFKWHLGHSREWVRGPTTPIDALSVRLKETSDMRGRDDQEKTIFIQPKTGGLRRQLWPSGERPS